jgi:hypothetical protein
MTPITIRADTPRQAVEEVCKWLEVALEQWDPPPSAGPRHAYQRLHEAIGMERALLRAVNALRSATIEPKEQADAS